MSKGWAGGSDTRWRTFRLAILERDHHTCRIGAAGCTGKATHVDHVVPLAMGGAKYDASNCRAACEHCNVSRRVTKTFEEPQPKRISSW